MKCTLSYYRTRQLADGPKWSEGAKHLDVFPGDSTYINRAQVARRYESSSGGSSGSRGLN